MADEQPADTAPAAPTEEQAPAEAAAEALAEDAPAEAAAPEAEAAETQEAVADAAPDAAPDAEAAPATDEAPAEEAAAPADDAEAPPAEGGEAPPSGEGEEAPAAGEAEGEVAPPAEGGEPAEGEGEAKPEGEQAAEGEAAAAAEGAETEGADQPPAEGDGADAEQAPAEAAEGQAETAEGEAPAEGEGTEGGEALAEAPAEGEQREGSPLVVGEQLSREGSPIAGLETDRTDMSPPVPGTPDDLREHVILEEPVAEGAYAQEGTGSLKEGDEEEEMEEEEEEEEEPEFDRELLIDRYHQALAEREQQLQQNYQLQHKLAEHFRKKKSEETRQEVDKNVTDSEQRYVKYMAQLDDLRAQDGDERETYKLQIEEMKERCQAKQALVEDDQSKFMEFQKQVALNSLNSRSGKPIPPKDIEQYLAVEARKEAEVVNVRLENIKLKNKLKKKEQQLKSKEELAEGLHLIDFEQLKIENQTYNEKIEERNEDLLKLRKKITSTVQVLTHLKEKLQFVHAENQVLKTKLHEVEDEAAKKRDKLTRTKQARDHLRIDNHRLRQNCGLLGNEPLLRDFEERKDESTDLRDKLEELKMQHSELTLSCNGVRKKIDQARLGRI